MGLMDIVRGKRPAPEGSSEPSPSGQPAATFSEAGTFQPIGDAGPPSPGFAKLPSSAPTFEAVGDKMYNPYESLNTVVGARGGSTAFKLPKQPEYLFIEEANVKRRTWSENLTYYTGCGYLGGALAGGGAGLVSVLTTAHGGTPAGVPQTTRLMINRCLNSSGQAGRAAGNALGVLGLMFSGSESAFLYVNDEYLHSMLPESACTIAAGFATGAMFRAPRGAKTAVVAGGLGAAGACLLVAGRQFWSGL